MGLPVGVYSPATATYRDAGNEDGRFRCYGTLLSDVNYAARQTLWSALMTATDALCLGVRIKSNYGNETSFTYTQPTNGAARETKLLVQYKDDTNDQPMTCTVPTLNPTLPEYVINQNAKDVVILTAPVTITGWITAFEAFAINPRTGNSVIVTGLKVVGRNI